jgi:membrane protein
LWLWLTNVALLFGAELDSELERARELEAGIAAESELQLPARDTRGIRKARQKEQKDIARGRAIREQAAEEDSAGDREPDEAAVETASDRRSNEKETSR